MAGKSTHVGKETEVDNDDGLSATERDRKEDRERLYRWLRESKRRV
ncbi:hypothetical protein GF367_00670 [Candidatus Woesearchaeota archaeon]|nr:hypothetical protein [Candidatus Woesearchaeota archaeon]